MNKEIAENMIHDFLINQETCIYIANKNTHQIEYATDGMKKQFGGDIVGKKCYEVCTGRSEPCKHCKDGLKPGEYGSWELHTTGDTKSMYLEKSLMNNDLMICQLTDISEYYLLISDVVGYSRVMCRDAETKGLTDMLTGLGNRNKFIAKCEREYKKLDSVAVMYFDINNMKYANDTYGHDAGDELICHAADTIKSVITEKTDAYRIGGDEFVIVINDATREILTQITNEWNRISKNFTTKSGISCNIASGNAIKEKGDDFDEVLRRADRNMYENKQKMKTAR